MIREWLLRGYAPPAPLLDAGAVVVTFGSCFARELRDHLASIGCASENYWVPEGLNNTFALVDFLSWCVTGEQSGTGYRYNRIADEAAEEWMPDADRAVYAQRLANADAYVLTIGVAEVWRDRETGGAFWRGVPAAAFDASRHELRLSSVDENEDNIAEIVRLIRSVNASAPIVLTLSPVPLAVTFRNRPAVAADCVSKSTLRVAIEQVIERGGAGVYYWPSFEVIRWAGSHAPWSALGENGKPWEPSRRLVAAIVAVFVECYYTVAAVDALRPPAGGPIDARVTPKQVIARLRSRVQRMVRRVPMRAT